MEAWWGFFNLPANQRWLEYSLADINTMPYTKHTSISAEKTSHLNPERKNETKNAESIPNGAMCVKEYGSATNGMGLYLQVANVCEEEKQRWGDRGEKVKGREWWKEETEGACTAHWLSPASLAVSCQHLLGQNVTNWWSILLVGRPASSKIINPLSSVRPSSNVEVESCSIWSSPGLNKLLSSPHF